MFRGYFTLDGVEIANSSRVVSHLLPQTPTHDAGLFLDAALWIEDPPGSGLYIPRGVESPPGSGLYDLTPLTSPTGLYPVSGEADCSLVRVWDRLYEVPETAVPAGARLYAPPDGTRRYGRGLLSMDEQCWRQQPMCGQCRTLVSYDDSWPGLVEFLNDTTYRPELAPWYSTQIPESAEFAGLWISDVKGLGPAPVSRPITEMVGSGASAGRHRDGSRSVSFEGLLIGCTNAGLEYGLEWLTCRLRETNDTTDAVLRYLIAHPSYSAADPASLVREAHGVVLTSAPEIGDKMNLGGASHQQASVYRITWTMTVLSPFVYYPPVDVPVEWDEITTQPIKWVHDADCREPQSCETMPVLFSTDCVPEVIDVVTSPPPSCGGCMPLCQVQTHVFTVPTMTYPFRCRETAASVQVTNVGTGSLTVQGHWRICNTNIECEDNRFPVQISGLVPQATLTLDGVTGRYWADYDERRRRPIGIVGTPNGAPWRPPIIDRELCWEFVVIAPDTANFNVSMRLTDREA